MQQVANENIKEILSFINPVVLSYQEWVNIGMALKDEGFDSSVWDEWSQNDSRYHAGECERKWKTFNGAGSSSPVTIATVMQMAYDNGYRSNPDSYELDWDSEIGGSKDDFVIVDKNWTESKEIKEPAVWNPAAEIIKYLETLFDSTETVGYVTETWEKDGKFMPSKGSYTHTAGELIQELGKHKDDIGAVIGDYNKSAGAWVRFNPLDGKGVKNENVTDFRYALVESDTMEIDKQNAVIRELELPVAVLVYSGKKSLHAIVRIEAANYDEYRKRVDYLYNVCKKNGLQIDSQNRNPSRLSRLPGIERGENKQFIVDTNIGKASFAEWKEWIESVNDDLPDMESLDDVWGNLPELSPPLIDGILRQGHKMLIAGPSKAGKSYALIEMSIALAEGASWLGFKCTQGKVLYVNLELDRASCLHRFKDVYTALGLQPHNLKNIDIWNLRGRSVPMNKLAPKLIRRAAKKNYAAVIIDPIYKVITGDENSADQMAAFCNQFDKVCTELNCAVIYCHHHSKGAQGGKRSMDRASGSGVFARDPDALLDLIELELPQTLIDSEKNEAFCKIYIEWLDRWLPGWRDGISQDDMCKCLELQTFANNHLKSNVLQNIDEAIAEKTAQIESRTAWRIECTLREFPKPAALNLWFDYPIHIFDNSGKLKDVEAEGVNSKGSPYRSNFGKKKSKEQKKKDRSDALITAYDACKIDGPVTVSELCDYLGKSEDTIRNYVKETKQFEIKNNIVFEV